MYMTISSAPAILYTIQSCSCRFLLSNKLLVNCLIVLPPIANRQQIAATALCKNLLMNLMYVYFIVALPEDIGATQLRTVISNKAKGASKSLLYR